MRPSHPLKPAAISAFLLASAPMDVMALGVEERLQIMEQRLRDMEGRLQRTESENITLRRQLAAHDPKPSAIPSETKQLDTRITHLEQGQERDRNAAAEAAKTATKVELGANGFAVKSADDNYRLAIRGYAQADGNFYMDDHVRYSSTDTSHDKPIGLSDKFAIRRARLTIDGSLFKAVDFRLSPDFGRGDVRLFDAFVDIHYFPWASVMAGKFRPPINGLERQQGAPNLVFAERALTQNLTPTRDIGIMLHGQFAYPGYTVQYSVLPVFKEFLTYELGVFNGARDSENLDTERDDAKEFAGRLFSHPFLRSGIASLQGLGLGIAGSWGHPTQNPLRALSSDGQQNFFTYNDGVTAHGEAYRFTPQAYWYYGPFGLLTEYVWSSQQLWAKDTKHGVVTTRQDNSAWQVQLSYVLTGEDNAFYGIKPARVFDPLAGNWGALQIAARWNEMHVDDATFAYDGAFADPSKSAREAVAWGLGLNWFLNNQIKLMADYEQTMFQGGAPKGGDRPHEKVFITRFQYQF